MYKTGLWPGNFMILLSCLFYLCVEVALNVQFVPSVISLGMTLYHLWNDLFLYYIYGLMSSDQKIDARWDKY